MCAVISTLNKIDTIFVGNHEFSGPHIEEHLLRPVPGICIVLIDAGHEFHLQEVFETDNVREAWKRFELMIKPSCGSFCVAVNYDRPTAQDRKNAIIEIMRELPMPA